MKPLVPRVLEKEPVVEKEELSMVQVKHLVKGGFSPFDLLILTPTNSILFCSRLCTAPITVIFKCLHTWKLMLMPIGLWSHAHSGCHALALTDTNML